MSRDARVADPPTHEIQVGEVQLKIDERFTYTDESGDTRTETSNTQTTLTTSDEFAKALR